MSTVSPSSAFSPASLPTLPAKETEEKEKKSKKKPEPDFLGGLQKQIEDAEKKFKKAQEKWSKEVADKHPRPTVTEPLDGAELLRRLEALQMVLVSDWIESHDRMLLDALDEIVAKYGKELTNWNLSTAKYWVPAGTLLGIALYSIALYIFIKVVHLDISLLPGFTS